MGEMVARRHNPVLRLLFDQLVAATTQEGRPHRRLSPLAGRALVQDHGGHSWTPSRTPRNDTSWQANRPRGEVNRRRENAASYNKTRKTPLILRVPFPKI